MSLKTFEESNTWGETIDVRISSHHICRIYARSTVIRLKSRAEEELVAERKAENKAIYEFSMVKQGLEDQINADFHDLSDAKTAKAEAEQTKETASGDLQLTEEEPKTLKEYFETISTDCIGAATNHEASLKSRVEDAVDGSASFLQVQVASKEQSHMHLAKLTTGASQTRIEQP